MRFKGCSTKLLHHTITFPKGSHPTLHLWGLGCLHADSDCFKPLVLQATADDIRSRPNSRWFGMGDYTDIWRTTARKFFATYQEDGERPQDSLMKVDKMVRREMVDIYTKLLKPIEKECLGLLEGNHYYQFQDGTTSTQLLCQLMNVPYLENVCFARLQLRAYNRTIAIIKNLLHHGHWGSGVASTGADVNAWESKAKGFGFDVHWASHTHRKWATLKPEVTIPDTGELEVIHRERAFIKTGCCVTTYVCGTENYGQKKLMEPTEPGYVRLEIECYREYDKKRYARWKERRGRNTGGTMSNWRHRFKVHY